MLKISVMLDNQSKRLDFRQKITIFAPVNIMRRIISQTF